MAIEHFAGEPAADVARVAYDSSTAIRESLLEHKRMSEQNEPSYKAYREGVDDANREWSPKYEEALKRDKDISAKYIHAEQEKVELEKRLKNEIRKSVYLDCQRFGYSEAIGLLKGLCDYSNRFTKNYKGKVQVFDRFYHATGEIVPLYEEPTVTNIKLSDFPDINDEAHKFLYKGDLEEGNGVLSVYEEYFLRGFWHRATKLWEKAEAENDKLTLEVIGSLRTLKSRCFWQEPNDQRGLAERQREGYAVVEEKLVPFWEEQIEKTKRFIKAQNLSDADILAMQNDYNNEESKARKRVKEEKKCYAEKGIDKTYFI